MIRAGDEAAAAPKRACVAAAATSLFCHVLFSDRPFLFLTFSCQVLLKAG